jgi:hypothetical protein
VKKEDIAEAT